MGFISKWSSDWLTPSSEATRTSQAADIETWKATTSAEAKKDKKNEAHKASKKEKEVLKAKDVQAEITRVTIDLEEPDTERTDLDLETIDE